MSFLNSSGMPAIIPALEGQGFRHGLLMKGDIIKRALLIKSVSKLSHLPPIIEP